MIEPALVDAIANKLGSGDLDETAVSALRTEYPEVHFTFCADDDVTTGMPVAERPGFNVYLVDGRDHCLQLTGDYAAATGLVLAYCSDEE
jgi:hypothetical protein